MLSGLENPTHWLVVIVVALIVFGPKRLPELGRSLGSGIRGFKDSLEGKDEAPLQQPARPETVPVPETARVTTTEANPDAR